MNLVLTICFGEKFEAIGEVTHPAMRAYAKRIGAEFLVLNEGVAAEERWTEKWNTAHWQKFHIADLLNRYDRIIYFDTDTLIRDDCPNLFDVVPAADLALFDENPFVQGRSQSLVEVCREYGVTLPRWDGRYFNTGVMVIPRRWKFLFRLPAKQFNSFGEQGYVNMRIHKELASAGNELRVFNLPYKFNRMVCMGGVTGEERVAAYVIHYAGFPDVSRVPGMARLDAARWAADSGGGYKYQRHIWIDVQGGLGDQVNAQPALRYLVERIYPGDDIVVLTHFPLLFKDIAGIRVFQHGDYEAPEGIPYRVFSTLPGPETQMWSIVSNLLCHTVDYCSMALLRRTLPYKDKSIQLKVEPEWVAGAESVCGSEMENLTVVHCGKHWPSKTFPLEWWQEVVDGLQAAGHRVCLIGRDELTRGVLPVIAREGMINARNLLDLGELIALLSRARLLVSNDSAPVHLAGAFDNEMILIPSCKHPDHVLPFRNGTVTHRTRALYRKLTLDDIGQAPTEIHGVEGHLMEGDWKEYLPSPKEITDEC